MIGLRAVDSTFYDDIPTCYTAKELQFAHQYSLFIRIFAELVYYLELFSNFAIENYNVF